MKNDEVDNNTNDPVGGNIVRTTKRGRCEVSTHFITVRQSSSLSVFTLSAVTLLHRRGKIHLHLTEILSSMAFVHDRDHHHDSAAITRGTGRVPNVSKVYCQSSFYCQGHLLVIGFFRQPRL